MFDYLACPGDQKKVLVLLNPKSGPGRGRETFQRRIHPILSEADKPYEVHITRYCNYARDFVRTKDIYQWSGLVMVGGDGIVFEVVNGILQRPDWEKALKELPLGVIPCGSGNGLAKSIAYARQEPFDHNPMLISALSIVKCKKAPMDLVRVETKKQILFSFLSIGWGLIADIDIESEHLRAIGGQRFTIWSVARLIGLRTYKGKVSYLPYDKIATMENMSNGNIFHKNEANDNDPKVPHSKSFGDELDRVGGMRESKSYHDALDSKTNGLGDILNNCNESEVLPDTLELETETQSRHRLDSFYSATSVKSTYFSTGSISSYQSMNEIEKAGKDTENGSNDIVTYGPPSSIPALTSPVPDTWTHIQGEFVMVHATYQSHLAQDCILAPHARLADGIIWLLVIRAGISRAHLLQFLLGMSNGSHLSCPGVEMIPVKAFRIEPAESTNGHLTVDGENVDYGSIQAEIFPSLATVMCP